MSDATTPEEARAAYGESGEPPVVIRDRRRIDPDSGAVREASLDEEQPEATGVADGTLQALVDERTADLQRLKAEYDNYRRRVDRDRQVAGELAAGKVLAALLPTLDDINRARAHGELEGGFKSVAEGLEKTLAQLGLSSYAEVGDPFDPQLHDALMHSYSDSVTEPTCTDVLSKGWTYAGRVLRPAQVAVAEPEQAPAAETPGEG